MTKQKLNLRLLRKVRNRIAEIPESYYQRDWMRESDAAPCGTVACLAGETVICAAPSVAQGIKDLRRAVRAFERGFAYDIGVVKKARTLLGISLEDAERMFGGYADEWPQPFKGRFERAKRQQTKAKIAVAYLDECLKRKAVTW